MRGQILLKALEILEDVALSQFDFFEAVLASGYGASMGRIDYEYEKRQQIKEANKNNLKLLQKRRRRLQLFIGQMKHNGLIEEFKNSLKISDKGRQKIVNLKNKLPYRHYVSEKQNKVTIISFDIPEKLRRKRNWLREVIKNLGFNMIHQSVWMGKKKIPQKLITDLEDLKILEFIEIFEVTKTGSLRKIGDTK